MDDLKTDIASSELCQNTFNNLIELSVCFNNTLSSILEKHAPLQSRPMIVRPRMPWFN